MSDTKIETGREEFYMAFDKVLVLSNLDIPRKAFRDVASALWREVGLPYGNMRADEIRNATNHIVEGAVAMARSATAEAEGLRIQNDRLTKLAANVEEREQAASIAEAKAEAKTEAFAAMVAALKDVMISTHQGGRD